MKFIHDNKLYFFVDGLTWTDAQANAVAYKGNLVTVNSEELNNLLLENLTFVGPGVWIGLKRDISGGEFSWVSGESVSYTNWQSGEPNNLNNVEQYVHAWGAGVDQIDMAQPGSWADAPNNPALTLDDAWWGSMKGIAEVPLTWGSDSSSVYLQTWPIPAYESATFPVNLLFWTEAAGDLEVFYKITSDSMGAADIGIPLSGSVIVSRGIGGSNAALQIPIVVDSVLEGPEWATVQFYSDRDFQYVIGPSQEIELRDAFGQGEASYSLSALSNTVSEGSSANVTLTTQNVPEGVSFFYSISGISPTDILGNMTGSAYVTSDGSAVVTIPLVSDMTTEGDESLVFSALGETLTILVKDTSTAIVNDTSSTATSAPSPSTSTTPSPTPGASSPSDSAGQSEVSSLSNTQANEIFEAAVGQSLFEVSGNSSDYSVRSADGGRTWQLNSPLTGSDTLSGFKRIAFEDKTLALDFSSGDAGYESAMLIGAAFGSQYVSSYFSAGLSLFDLGRDTAYVCDLIVKAGLIESQIGSASDQAWVRHVYKNVVGAFPDAFTEIVLVDFLESGQFTRSTLLAAASDLDLLELQVDVAGLQTTGLAYTPFI